MDNDIAIFGAGGFGREVALMIRQINQVHNTWNLIGFFDDVLPKEKLVDGIKILGGLEELNQVREKLSIVIAVADPIIRKSIVAKMKSHKIDFPVIVHPYNSLGDTTRNTFGRGSIITAGNIFTTNIQLQEFVIVNLACTIGHDVRINSFATLMPGCNISGNVAIGESTLIGSGAVVLQNINIGNACKVGAGAVVTKSSRNGVTLVGVPAIEV
jgi:sugar O-acyltransferase (sialic acid O-acetyltransferase NeuD family)